MKKTVKILIATVFAVGFVSLANAQSASISANATVISELKVSNLSNLNFGTIVVGQTKTILADNTVEVSSGSKIGTTNRGRFSLEAQVGSNVTLTFVLPENLTTTEGALLPIEFDWAGASEGPIAYEDGDGALYKIIPGTSYQILGFNSGSEMPTSNVLVGGRVNATGVTPGTYSGTITLSAIYN